ncbi:MAG: discoidin domain-containing protein [Balneolales bacterium]
MKFINISTILIIGFICIPFACTHQTNESKINDITLNARNKTSQGWPIIELPSGIDPDDPNWEGIDLAPKPPVLPKTPDQQLHHMLVPQGYNLELVVSEPAIQEPAAIAFDGNGRMYVVELRTYMQDVEATGEAEPLGRISRHEDTNNDGIYDHFTVFVDSLVFPRFVLPLGGDAVLTMESHSSNVYKYIDTNNDGISDTKELFAGNFGRAQNVERQPSSLTWAMDNWMYSTLNSKRLRWNPDGETLTEPTGPSGGQWGITMDDYGKIWVQEGASGLPGYFQFPIAYGNFDLNREEKFDEGLQTTYGAPIKIADMQGGMDQIRSSDGSLITATAGSGNDIFRGHRLPEDLRGDYIYGEPVGRIVRRLNSTVSEGLTKLGNVYQKENTEFIRSTDPLFRPLEMATAPDGTLYIVDIYRGIIQQGTWIPPDSYLRAKINQYQLDKIIRHGRIWRLSHESMARDKRQPRMLEETPLELVEHLRHPNGWWRDTAQKLLILSQDRSVTPVLEEMARTSDNELTRIHALWTLEGLGALEDSMIRAFFKDSNPNVRLQAIRASETLYKMGDQSFEDDYRTLTKDENVDVALQAMLTLNYFDVSDIDSVIKKMQEVNPARGIQKVGDMILEQRKSNEGRKGLTSEQISSMERGSNIYSNNCSQCHGSNGLGTPVGEAGGATLAPSLSNSSRIQGHPDFVVKTLLLGLTGSDGKVMPSMRMNTDQMIADVISYIRNSMGNRAAFVKPEYVAKLREVTSDRTTPYTREELIAEIPSAIEFNQDWGITASHSEPFAVGYSAEPSAAFSLEGWTTGETQQPGMWYQIELPEPINLTEIKFRSASIRGSTAMTYPRGYRLEISMDGDSWLTVSEGLGEDVTSGINKNSSGHGYGFDQITLSTIKINPTEAKYIRLTQTVKVETDLDDPPTWTMQGLQIFAI